MPTRFQVEIAESAERDLEEIWTYIAQDSPQAASLFVLELEKKAHTLETFPRRCPLIPENEFLGSRYRHLLIDKYRVIFRISEKRVFVLRIVHGARLLDIFALQIEGEKAPFFEDKNWSLLSSQSFFAGYSDEGSVYDSL